MKHNNTASNKVLLIGWDAADWNIINPLLQNNQLPALKKVLSAGSQGKAASLQPMLSPMLWTSIATGTTADKHGILGFTEERPDGKGIQPITIKHRKQKAIWNILNEQGYNCNVIGWWPSYPAEQINGIVTTEYFGYSNSNIQQAWPVLPDTVHPWSMSEKIGRMRVHPQELTNAHIAPFFNGMQHLSDSDHLLITSFICDLAKDATTHNIVTWAMEHTQWDFTAVYYNGLDAVCHNFMKFMPPHQNGVPEATFHRYKDVVSNMYKYYDMMLDRLLALAPENCNIFLVSDHGFHINNKRLARLPDEPLAPEHEHNPYGILAAAGPGIKANQTLNNCTLLDIAPSILHLFGLSALPEMDGKVLTQILKQTTQNKPFVSNTLYTQEKVCSPPNEQMSQLLIKQLTKLGYIENTVSDFTESIKTSTRINTFNLARVYIAKNEYDKAIPLLEELLNDYQRRYLMQLFECYEALNKTHKAKALLNTLVSNEKTQTTLHSYMYGRYYALCCEYTKALECFTIVLQKKPHIIGLHYRIGLLYYRLNNYNKAIEHFSADQQNGAIHYWLCFNRGVSWYKINKHHQALNDFMEAVKLQYEAPLAHYYIGQILFEQQRYAEAEKALLLSFKQKAYNKTYQRLTELYSITGNTQAANTLEKQVSKIDRKEIIIVSGLPRSGTSLLMQVLHSGGIACFNDNERQADDNNPNGYFEHELVKKLPDDNTWLSLAENKCMKVVSPLLFYLPDDYNYKVLLIERDLNEIALSQKRMLQRRKIKINEENYPLQLMKAFEQNKIRVEKWLQNSHVNCLKVNFHTLIASPEEIMHQIQNFLGKNMAIQSMIKAVEPSLYREKLCQSELTTI